MFLHHCAFPAFCRTIFDLNPRTPCLTCLITVGTLTGTKKIGTQQSRFFVADRWSYGPNPPRQRHIFSVAHDQSPAQLHRPSPLALSDRFHSDVCHGRHRAALGLRGGRPVRCVSPTPPHLREWGHMKAKRKGTIRRGCNGNGECEIDEDEMNKTGIAFCSFWPPAPPPSSPPFPPTRVGRSR